MSRFLPMICPTCGSQLAPTEDSSRFVCASCGNEYLLDQRGGLQPPGPEVKPASTPRMPPLTAEVRARLEADTQAAWEQQQAAFRQHQPWAYWLQAHRRAVSILALIVGLLLIAAVYGLILNH
jgi:hypothetical protein